MKSKFFDNIFFFALGDLFIMLLTHLSLICVSKLDIAYEKMNKQEAKNFLFEIDSLVKKTYIKAQVDYMMGDIRIKPDLTNNRWILIKTPYELP